MANEPLKGHLDLMLLQILASGPAHGYQVIEALRQRSDGAFDLPEGTVYPALHRLERTGALTSSWDGSTGRRRRIYQLTPRGRGELRTARSEWQRFSTGVFAVLGATA
ncbi:MAG TPA: helix-turn-helix transcriptional regulator [Mycobacteriales bacterium]|nr:helix-turn-helix transcriptional regulator [Mycobacteriales bacterium]